MRHTELRARLEAALGTGYYQVWADTFVMSDLGGRTVTEALDAGVEPKQVWAVVWRVLELPDRER
ncbi:DUF3046 domain-containing protein [Nocardioides sp. cx-169]|uniref:DUF3046 domain-containing protein n=1 Tax=Nocardioides sp. cx-169 TaxID=2899080 RepID=UPI001E31F023|nr:DUF3046 domain-containing protein [Nocardioides sp. cx-169]MCD4535596.1 DUF3046 domain-containing protein [Nocardioides sp. cx-169]